MKSCHLLLVFAIFSPPLAALQAADSSKAATRPNLVFFLADDLRSDCLDVLGHPMVKTPNLIQFIKDNAGTKPLFVYMASREPHYPHHATEEFYRMYNPETISLPVNFLPFHPFDNGDMTVADELTPTLHKT